MVILPPVALDSSKPITDDPRKVIKQGAKDGIGDDLPDEWKTYLLNLAGEVSNWVLQQNNPAKAKAIIDEAVEVDQLDGDMIIFMERHLDSKVRSALRKLNQGN